LVRQALAPLLATHDDGIGINVVASQIDRLEIVFQASHRVPKFNFKRFERQSRLCGAFLASGLD